VISVQKINEDKFLISIKPNSSLVGKYRIIFLLSISLVCGGIATAFYFFGATLILPFAGLELSILFIAFYLSFKWSSKREKVFISQELVTIEKGRYQADYRWEEFRTFTSFQVTKDINEVLKLSFRSKGEDIEVGAFLNEEDKHKLKEEVSEIIKILNEESFLIP
tara:strand:+ start:180 stop:674 length:495 start_codon:yes stop_codon:yes gene_type:complete